MDASRKDPHRVLQWEDRGPDQCLRLVNEGGTKRAKRQEKGEPEIPQI